MRKQSSISSNSEAKRCAICEESLAHPATTPGEPLSVQRRSDRFKKPRREAISQIFDSISGCLTRGCGDNYAAISEVRVLSKEVHSDSLMQTFPRNRLCCGLEMPAQARIGKITRTSHPLQESHGTRNLFNMAYCRSLLPPSDAMRRKLSDELKLSTAAPHYAQAERGRKVYSLSPRKKVRAE